MRRDAADVGEVQGGKWKKGHRPRHLSVLSVVKTAIAVASLATELIREKPPRKPWHKDPRNWPATWRAAR